MVSINLCTDQLALLLADPGQVVSVSFLAHDPRTSAMVGAAQGIPANQAQAEEVFLLHPDLVLAGTFSPPDVLRMLRRLGVRVEQLPIANSIEEARAGLITMGRLLGQEARAARVLAAFDARLAGLREEVADRPSVALYGANGYTRGLGTMADDILTTAGYENIASSVGLPGGGNLALERLVMIGPDLVLTDQRYPGASRAEALLDHPALAPLLTGQAALHTMDPRWTCGTPHVLDVIAELVALRHQMDGAR